MCARVSWWSAKGAPDYRVQSTEYREANRGDWLAGVWLARRKVGTWLRRVLFMIRRARSISPLPAGGGSVVRSRFGRRSANGRHAVASLPAGGGREIGQHVVLSLPEAARGGLGIGVARRVI